jgi:diadenosine tetraphosphate (Ap4A) HIT family hydrolase
MMQLLYFHGSIVMLGSSHTCTFCSEEVKGRILAKQGTVYVVEDLYPVTHGHLLIIPFRHTLDYFTMSDEERLDAQHMLIALKEQIMSYDSTVQGFNIGINCGVAAGQSVLHAHIHLIPRREGIELFNKHFPYLR